MSSFLLTTIETSKFVKLIKFMFIFFKREIQLKTIITNKKVKSSKKNLFQHFTYLFK